jgi:hypothetical protein
VVQQALAGRRQAQHATAVAVQQLGVDRGFQVAQALADGRGGDELALGRSADAAELHTATNSCSEVRSMRRAKLRSELFMVWMLFISIQTRYRFSSGRKLLVISMEMADLAGAGDRRAPATP